eukprot:TRINITY_DN24316_c1_g1_i1.p1 TRINITY_DN24316_c1_g1~~TRINITY_DN24316_c1_g1_i1.p1  ORF type:complete len:153 (+),score=10.30 TRINITY_DN24316_c1_g1_i1:1-459(+)
MNNPSPQDDVTAALEQVISARTLESAENGQRALAVERKDNEEFKIMVATDGGIEGVIAALGEQVGSAEVQEHGCLALATFCTSDEHRVKLATAGGIEAVLEAMTAHVGSSAVQANGCHALANLTAGIGIVLEEVLYYCTISTNENIPTLVRK